MRREARGRRKRPLSGAAGSGSIKCSDELRLLCSSAGLV
ncbi:hypothetical protein I553_3318 [Mycobacterium xenopi 4042]|uniref:Uncharacterized protein n=1 Tax=Mycobacterium xenopi 4042 TaxID=1299334 RepID=X8CM92_MYCXE|nr:hypothetical protein I553_3318 [Mycobacterium xenopi 4042]